MIPQRIQKEIICYLPDKNEPVIVPAEIEDDVRREYIGHPKELEVRIEPYNQPQAVKEKIPQMTVTKTEPKTDTKIEPPVKKRTRGPNKKK